MKDENEKLQEQLEKLRKHFEPHVRSEFVRVDCGGRVMPVVTEQED